MYYERLLKGPSRKIHLTPEDFLKDVVEYFKWCETHPLLEEKVSHHKFGKAGEGEEVITTRTDEKRVRPFTKKGLSIHIGVPVSRLDTYKKRGGDWAEAVEMIEDAIFTQKFENAAAGLLNANLISRDLGLADKQEVQANVDAVVEEVKDPTPEEHRAIHVHPHDPDPLNLPRPLFSRAQLEAGIPFPE